MKITELSHKNSIWTWKGRKASVWLPYLQNVEKVRGGWRFFYNGGELEANLKEVDFILFYGASCDLPLALFDDFNKHNVIAILHRRGIPTPYVFHCANLIDTKHDILTQQILVRENQIKRNFVAKSLVRERLRSFSWLVEVPESHFQTLRAEKNYTKILGMESQHSRRFWDSFSRELGLEDWNRRADHPVTAALDAGSYFLMTMVLRWILFHKLSPAHGFLHKPTSYTSLAYDLMEPYRYLLEQSVYEAYLQGGDKELTETSISILKKKLDEWCYVPSQKGYVKRKNLLHGVVLALRAYLLKESKLIVIPVEGQKIGGRPVKTGYRIPGLKEKLKEK